MPNFVANGVSKGEAYGQLPKVPEKFAHKTFENTRVCPTFRSAIGILYYWFYSRPKRKSR